MPAVTTGRCYLIRAGGQGFYAFPYVARSSLLGLIQVRRLLYHQGFPSLNPAKYLFRVAPGLKGRILFLVSNNDGFWIESINMRQNITLKFAFELSYLNMVRKSCRPQGAVLKHVSSLLLGTTEQQSHLPDLSTWSLLVLVCRSYHDKPNPIEYVANMRSTRKPPTSLCPFKNFLKELLSVDRVWCELSCMAGIVGTLCMYHRDEMD